MALLGGPNLAMLASEKEEGAKHLLWENLLPTLSEIRVWGVFSLLIPILLSALRRFLSLSWADRAFCRRTSLLWVKAGLLVAPADICSPGMKMKETKGWPSSSLAVRFGWGCPRRGGYDAKPKRATLFWH